MNSEPPRSSRPDCRALAAEGACDEPSTLRGQVLDPESLRAHAAEVAHAHGKPKSALRAGPLRARFAETKSVLASAYAVLAGEERSQVEGAPAEEWLLDNRHIVEEQIREIEDDLPWGYLIKLPRAGAGDAARYPRVYAACVDYLRHTDARLDPESLAIYVDGYQTVSPLAMGELWAVPIMLRLGLLLVVSDAARTVTADTGRERAERWSRELLAHPERAHAILERIGKGDIDPAFLVHLWKLAREHDGSSQTIDWIRARANELGALPDELGRRIHLAQAADQLSVANAITSMRTLNTYEWSKFFERSSVVERILTEDSGGVFGATDPACRDRYRHSVEAVARRSRLDEPGVAKKALELARSHVEGARSHVGYYLEQGGRRELELACGAKLKARERIARVFTRHPRTFYFSSSFGLTALVCLVVWTVVRRVLPSPGDALVLTALLSFAASEVALSTVGAIVVGFLAPRLLSRFAFDDGVPEEHRTLVVVPVLFDSTATVERLVAELEVRALGNPDPNIHFALVSDYCDSEYEHESDDDAILEHAAVGIEKLNARHPLASGLPKYALFHRKRVRNEAQGCFMGWERKRGKLEELNRLILGKGETTFTLVTAPTALVSNVRYVITLDADTELPRAAAIRLVATLAHPLNRPVLDAAKTRVVEGYAVIQPRVGTVPSSSRRSRFARLTAGPSGLDPYTTAVSDVYQDLFGEGSYIGKAIYDVRAFAAVHDGRVPENRLLSHDLYEGIFARTALASDIELLDEQPPTYGVVSRRAHRWIRGDWQLLAFLGGRVDATTRSGRRALSALGLWKILDNLRRSLVAPTLVAALLVSCALWRSAAPHVALSLVLVLGAPVVLRFFTSVVRGLRSPSTYDSLWWDVRAVLLNAGLSLVVLFDQAVVAVDAIARTLYRLAISKKNLLEWQSTGLDRQGAQTPLRMWLEIPILAGALAFVARAHGSLAVAVPIALCWMGAPLLVDWLGRPEAFVDPAAALSEDDRALLHAVAKRTWTFFETFVTAEDHWLPPDNFQEEPRGVVAHRTSPTNVGLYLMASVSACDLGYITPAELVRRLGDTLDTIDTLEKHQGHILNWYDTTTLKPLEPRYVSTVDSGNLAAYLWTVAQACEEVATTADAATESASLAADSRRVAERATSLADAMSFSFLYDGDRSQFAIGYNVSTARLDSSRYDLLASEARLASLLAIAKGDVPEKHWFHLGRARCRVEQGRALLSWSGSMFEYLMPLLVMKSYPESLLDETHRCAIDAQRAHGKKHGVPWGVSEAAFNVMDLSMTYQYRAFGVRALGLKPGLDDDLVIAPYATALAAILEPAAAAKNFRALTAEGVEGKYGFFESIDYTPSRIPPNRRGVVVKTYMAHHQGMSLVALASVLRGAPMQRRFHADPRVKATELLLQERIPVGVPVLDERTSRAPAPPATGDDLSLFEHVVLERPGLARAHLLGHGDLATIVTSIGAGVLTWRDLDVFRFREDQCVDPYGLFIHVRDKTNGRAWSAGFEPTRVRAASYAATFSVDHVELQRRDRDIETTTEVVVSPEHAVELRRVTLTNHGDRPVEIELTTYGEVALAPRAADVAHRAFSSMFVELEEHAPLGALLATRRLKPGETLQPWLVQTLLPESDGWSPVELETSRGRFIGRGRDAASPQAIEATKLGGVSAHPLDPVSSLRRTITLKPKATARASLITGIAPSRDEALGLAQAYLGSSQIDRTFELAWADARVELKHLGVGAAQSFRFQRLLSFILDPHPSLRAPTADVRRGDGRAALWSLGVSGDLPLVVVRVDEGEATELCRELLVAHEFFRLNNFQMDLLILNEERAGYLQPLQEELMALVRSGFAQGHLDQRGGVFVRRASSIDERDRVLIQGAARVLLRTSGGSLARQLRVAMADTKAAPAVARKTAETEKPVVQDLAFDNGSGGFTKDGREYVVYAPTPAPWSNVLSNPSFGTLVTERGGGFTWSVNSQRYRLSPWSNDAVADPRGEAIYLRDDAGHVWLATQGTVRHGAGYSAFEGVTAGVKHTLTIAVAPGASVKLSKLSLENTTGAPMRLRACGYIEWVLGENRESSRLTTSTTWNDEVSVAFAQNSGTALAGRCSFFRATRPVARMTCDRKEFFAGFSPRAMPAGVGGALSGKSGASLDPCAALEVEITLAPHEKAEVAFVLGDAPDADQALTLAKAWGDLAQVDAAITSAQQAWDDTLGFVQIETPDASLDVMFNRWLLYQVLACRMWGRSAFYQSGGAYGFRDQLQDAIALSYARPELAREHLLRAGARQFEEGDVQHWWHAEDGAGLRTRCSDDMLWLAYATLEYVRVTGDRAVLDEETSFLSDRPIPPDQHDVFASPRSSSSKATLYEHCGRAVDVALTSGAHGLPLMRAGDWNDGMDRVGAEGKGESVWLAWFLVVVMRELANVADTRGDAARATRLRAETARISTAVDEQAWDGAWYRRAYFDDGSPLGSQSSAECRIDAIAQSWAVIAGTGDAARARQAVGEAETQLVKTDPPIMELLTPPFDGKGPDPGYLRTYPPGVRENGGQYTHGVLWTVQALAMLGESERAYALLSKLNPIHHAATAEDAKRYAVEPYVLAGDIYSSTEHAGRGGWSWYTGAAGWMYRIVLEQLLGIRIEAGHLTIRPRVPAEWKRYSVRVRRGGSLYEINVEPGDDLSVDVDGAAALDGRVELVDDGAVHTVSVKRRSATPSRLAG
jgi:cyclic beta-1,2-glucan synthetase